MATDNERDKRGQFAKGNTLGKGRAPGSENRTTVDLRHIRDGIVATWNAVEGNRRLIELAERDFQAYAKLVFPLLPKAHELKTTNAVNIEPKPFDTDETRSFREFVCRVAGNRAPTTDDVLRALREKRDGPVPAMDSGLDGVESLKPERHLTRLPK